MPALYGASWPYVATLYRILSTSYFRALSGDSRLPLHLKLVEVTWRAIEGLSRRAHPATDETAADQPPTTHANHANHATHAASAASAASAAPAVAQTQPCAATPPAAPAAAPDADLATRHTRSDDSSSAGETMTSSRHGFITSLGQLLCSEARPSNQL